MPLHLNTLKPLPKSERAWASSALAGWNTLNKLLPDLDKAQVRALLVHELITRRRVALLSRLVTRYSKLEARENQDELMRAVHTLGPEDP